MYKNTKSILLCILFKIYMTYDSTKSYTNWMMYSSRQTMPLPVVSRIQLLAAAPIAPNPPIPSRAKANSSSFHCLK